MQPATENFPIDRFGSVAIALHWLIAAGIVTGVAFGLISGAADTPEVTQSMLAVHQSIGTVVLLLAIFRAVWRLTHAVPAPLPAPRLQIIAASVTHGLLYLLLFALPVTGYIGLAARGRAITILGLFDLPRLVPLSRSLSATSQSLHDNGQYLLYVLLALHVGAALYHQYVVKDRILARMWPQRS